MRFHYIKKPLHSKVNNNEIEKTVYRIRKILASSLLE
jgi:hypothetical protein